MNLLQTDRIGRHDNFFLLGGHSLLAVKMITQICSLMGFKITLATLFLAPAIAELVLHLLTAGDYLGDAFMCCPLSGLEVPVFLCSVFTMCLG